MHHVGFLFIYIYNFFFSTIMIFLQCIVEVCDYSTLLCLHAHTASAHHPSISQYNCIPNRFIAPQMMLQLVSEHAYMHLAMLGWYFRYYQEVTDWESSICSTLGEMFVFWCRNKKVFVRLLEHPPWQMTHPSKRGKLICSFVLLRCHEILIASLHHLCALLTAAYMEKKYFQMSGRWNSSKKKMKVAQAKSRHICGTWEWKWTQVEIKGKWTPYPVSNPDLSLKSN